MENVKPIKTMDMFEVFEKKKKKLLSAGKVQEIKKKKKSHYIYTSYSELKTNIQYHL